MATIASAATERQFILAFDAGGTMTDALLVKPDGSFTVGKAITRRDDEPRSYRESVVDAANNIGVGAELVHAQCAADIYCGTGMLNTVLTGNGRKVGLLVTRGFEDISVMEGGLTYLGQTQNETLHQQLHRLRRQGLVARVRQHREQLLGVRRLLHRGHDTKTRAAALVI